jgi:hypothetical protein
MGRKHQRLGTEGATGATRPNAEVQAITIAAEKRTSVDGRS